MFDILKGSAVAQLAHVGWGAYLTLRLKPHFHWKGFIVIVVFAFIKEVMEALGIAPWEPKQTWASSMIDFAFWVVGALLGALV